MVAILLKHGADINLKCVGKGNTALMWAAWRNNLKMVEFLFESGADIEELNNDHQNALDVCIIRMSYETALFLKKKGLVPKDAEYYHDKWAVLYDVPLFIEKLENEELITSYKIFHERIIREEKEWLSKDLVIDPRESWKEWFVRNANFDEPPLIPREDIPENLQPHQTFYGKWILVYKTGKLTWYLNGINPYPPGHKYNPARNNETLRNLDSADVSRNANEMKRTPYQHNGDNEEEKVDEESSSSDEEKW